MQPEWSPRIGWADLPAHVQEGVEQILDARVLDVKGQQGGFSPGTADRVRTDSGSAAFIKAVSRRLNEDTPGIHRKEAAVTSALNNGVPAPSLIGTFDDGEWVALVLTDVEGSHPHIPWRTSELMMVLDALLEVARTPVAPALESLPRLEHDLADAFNGWARIRADPPAVCDEWISENFDALEELAESGLEDLAGGSLVHTDIRADNILITPGNTAVLVDWPWACIGSPWMDALSLLINVRIFDPAFHVESAIDSHEVFEPATPGAINNVLSGLAAYFIDSARRPAPTGLPSVRGFQQQQGDVVIGWLRQRLSGAGL